jgi:hypothetical protein
VTIGLKCVVALLIAVGVAGCEAREPAVTPPEFTYTRSRLQVVVDGVTETADVAEVRPAFFEDDLKPLLGRFFVVDEYQPGRTAVAVLSDAYWRSRFNGRPDAIGSKVGVDGRDRVIIGVAPPQLQPEKPASVFVPSTSR